MLVNESSTAVLECEVENIKKNRVKWIKDGKEVVGEQQDTNLTNIINNNSDSSDNITNNDSKDLKYQIDPSSHKLTIASINSNDEGIYDCAIYHKDEFIIKAKKRFDLQIKGRCLMDPYDR